MRNLSDTERMLSVAKEEFRELEVRRAEVLEKIRALELEIEQGRPLSSLPVGGGSISESAVSNSSTPEEKIALFRRLFRGREDVYPRRFESAKTGRSGYQPVCGNEWIKPICKKPKGRCADCDHRAFLPVTDETVRNHLLGRDAEGRSKRDFTIGVYPMLQDETCWFLAVDFDKASWGEDVLAFLTACRAFGVLAALERSRSGNGGHVWIFFFDFAHILARNAGPVRGASSPLASSEERGHHLRLR